MAEASNRTRTGGRRGGGAVRFVGAELFSSTGHGDEEGGLQRLPRQLAVLPADQAERLLIPSDDRNHQAAPFPQSVDQRLWDILRRTGHNDLVERRVLGQL